MNEAIKIENEKKETNHVEMINKLINQIEESSIENKSIVLVGLKDIQDIFENEDPSDFELGKEQIDPEIIALRGLEEYEQYLEEGDDFNFTELKESLKTSLEKKYEGHLGDVEEMSEKEAREKVKEIGFNLNGTYRELIEKIKTIGESNDVLLKNPSMILEWVKKHPKLSQAVVVSAVMLSVIAFDAFDADDSEAGWFGNNEEEEAKDIVEDFMTKTQHIDDLNLVKDFKKNVFISITEPADAIRMNGPHPSMDDSIQEEDYSKEMKEELTKIAFDNAIKKLKDFDVKPTDWEKNIDLVSNFKKIGNLVSSLDEKVQDKSPEIKEKCLEILDLFEAKLSKLRQDEPVFQKAGYDLEDFAVTGEKLDYDKYLAEIENTRENIKK